MIITLTKTFGKHTGGPVTIFVPEGRNNSYIFEFQTGTIKMTTYSDLDSISFKLEGFEEEWIEYKKGKDSLYDILCSYLSYMTSFITSKEYYPSDISLDLKDELFLKKIVANFDDISYGCGMDAHDKEMTKEDILDGFAFTNMSYMYNCENIEVPEGDPINSYYEPEVNYSDFWWVW